MLSTYASVNFIYKYALSDKVSIFPYMGLNFKINTYGRLFGRSKYEIVSEGVIIEEVDEKFDINIFDEKEFETDAFRRFQIGWRIGGGFNFNKFYISANYGKDFNGLHENINLLPNVTVTLGLDF